MAVRLEIGLLERSLAMFAQSIGVPSITSAVRCGASFARIALKLRTPGDSGRRSRAIISRSNSIRAARPVGLFGHTERKTVCHDKQEPLPRPLPGASRYPICPPIFWPKYVENLGGR